METAPTRESKNAPTLIAVRLNRIGRYIKTIENKCIMRNMYSFDPAFTHIFLPILKLFKTHLCGGMILKSVK